MEEEIIGGEMVEAMKDSISMIKSMEWEPTLGLMEEGIQVSGLIVKGMGMVR